MNAKHRRWLDEAFFFFAFSVLSGAYVDLPLRLTAASVSQGDSNPFNSLAMGLTLCGLVALGGMEGRGLRFFAGWAWPVNLLLLLAALSAVWSVDPPITLRRTLTLGIAVFFGYYAVARFSMPAIIRRIALTSLVFAVSSAALAILLPRYGVMSEGELAGRWNGVFSHKQLLGQAIFLGILALSWLVARATGWARTGLCLAILFCMGVLLMARSQTALLSVFAIPLLSLMTRASSLSPVARLWAFYGMAVAAIGIAALFTLDSIDIMGVIGRDASLTGRAPLWDLLLEAASERLLTGYGYGAFWIAGNPVATRVNAISGWYVPEAHNGYLDILLQTGVPGLALVLIAVLSAIRHAFAAAAERTDWASFAVAFLIVAAVSNLVESMLFRSGDIQSVLVPMFHAALRARHAAPPARMGTPEAETPETGTPGAGTPGAGTLGTAAANARSAPEKIIA